eukprot:126499-Pleurochrysis_carterae.AAC.1
MGMPRPVQAGAVKAAGEASVEPRKCAERTNEVQMLMARQKSSGSRAQVPTGSGSEKGERVRRGSQDVIEP